MVAQVGFGFPVLVDPHFFCDQHGGWAPASREPTASRDIARLCRLCWRSIAAEGWTI